MDSIKVKELEIKFKNVNGEDYICLTDIAKHRNSNESRFIVYSWLKNKETLCFLKLWEELNNPSFNRVEFDTVTKDAGRNSFVISPKQWNEKLNGCGIFVYQRRYSRGIYAHQDIAFEFASWVSPEFKLYLIKEFQRLKEQENKKLEWSAKRELAKVNYHIHTDAIKEHIVPSLTREQINYAYASEADVLNVALFGKTASEWRKENPTLKGNIRDYAGIEQLLVIANLESYNAILIEQDIKQSDRLVMLNKMADSQLRVLVNNDKIVKMIDNS